MGKYYYLIVVVLFVSVYFIASHFEITEEKRLAEHRVGIENLNPLEQQIVGRWWSSISGFGSNRIYRNYMLFSADKTYWRRKSELKKMYAGKYGFWQINSEDSTLTIKYDSKKLKDRNFKIHAIDSNSIRIEEMVESKYDHTARWTRIE
ncbi:hypothetical protein V9L05_12985 [Bernardetia sp. Wsw4-3y2]|uniref:hypothetical protein n=1 Tax=unclassified Bernardetia TaxID=2647129 RepID=UPI0030CE3F1A